MSKIESRIGKVTAPAEKIFNYISNFENFSSFIPADKIQDWQATPDECSFKVAGIGQAGMKIIEKEPVKLIKIAASEKSQFDFSLWIQLKEVETNDTRIKITFEPKVNAMLQMMVKKPAKNFVDMLVEQIEKYTF